MLEEQTNNEDEELDAFMRRLPRNLLLAAWLVFIPAVTIGLPLFQRHPDHYGTTDHFSRSADLSWPSVLLKAVYGGAILFETSSDATTKKLLKALDAFVYYGSFTIFFLTPIYFLLRPRVQFVRWWAIPTTLTLGFAFSGKNSFDRLGATGVTKDYKGIGFFVMAIVFLMMVVAVWLNEWHLKKTRR